MKKLAVSLFLVIPLLLAATWEKIDSNAGKDLFEYSQASDQKASITFSLDGYNVDEKTVESAQYKQVSYDNEGEFIQTGLPGLPRFSRFIAIPADAQVNLRIVDYEVEVINNISIYPSQEKLQQKDAIDHTFEIDNDFYQAGSLFPATIASVGEPAVMRDLTVINVTINPFQFDPINSELYIYSNIQVELEVVSRSSSTIFSPDQQISRFFEPLYQASILNYDELRNTRDIAYQDPCYLFIYPQNLSLDDLQYLIDWRREKGFDVRLADTSSLQAGSNVNSIKNYLQDAYDNWDNPPEFVCLVGDADGSYVIPTGNSGGGEGDQIYSLLDGNDILADVWLGRLSIETDTHLQTIVTKILNYEKSPLMLPNDWLTNILLVGDNSSSGESTIIINKYIKELTQQYSTDYTYNEAYTGSYVSRIATAINAGCSFFNYRGYLGMSGWQNTNTNNLNNGFMLPFVTALTCATGGFTGWEEARSEAFLRAGTPSQPKGAIAAIGTATIYTHTCCNNCVVTGLYHGIFADGIYQAGGALARGKLNLYTNYPDNQSNLVDNFSYWINLMGDPALELWTGVPRNLGIICDTEIDLGSNFLEVQVIDDFGNPAENVWIAALSEDYTARAYGFSDAEGNLLLALDDLALIENSITLTASKHNFIPEQMQIDIISQAKSIAFNAFNIVDDNTGGSIGNGDGLINPGETIEFSLGLHNFGSETVTGVSAEISSLNNHITITDDSETFGDITAGNTTYSVDYYDFEIAEDILGGTEIKVNLLINDDEVNSWNDYVFITIDGINLTVDNYEIDDANNILDPGETVEMTVTLVNTGSIDADGVTATLLCANPKLTITDGTGSFEILTAGSSGNNETDVFVLSAAANVIPGSQFPLVLMLENVQGFSQELTFMLEVGEVTVNDPLGPDAYGYYAYDSGDIGYTSAPVYDWVEINPDFGGLGTSMGFSDAGDDGEIGDVDVPFDFKFYGENYNMLTICSNGFMSPGGTEQYSYMNWSIPGPLGPSPMIAPFWDDLMTSGGNVFYYYNEAENYFVVEWSDMDSEFNSVDETFEVIIYDPDYYPTPTGDAEIVFQYDTVNNLDVGNYTGTFHWHHGQYATVGIEDHTSQTGLQHTYNNTYPAAAAVLQNGNAIKFTTVGSEIVEYPVISVSDFALDFAQVEIGSTITDTVFITNTGNAVLEISQISNGTDEFAFSSSSNTIAIAETEELYITFSPTLVGVVNDVLIIDSNDPIHSEIEIALEGAGVYAVDADPFIAPLQTQVFQNTPNPFNPETTIAFALQEQQNVRLTVYNLKGEKVRTLVNNKINAGNHTVIWKGNDDNGKRVSSGVYFYKFIADDVSQLKKMLLLK